MFEVVYCPGHALTQRYLQAFATSFSFFNCQLSNWSSRPRELAGALIQPAGWQGGAIESLRSKHPSARRNAKSSRAHTAPASHLLPHSSSRFCDCVFVFHTQTRCSLQCSLFGHAVAVGRGGEFSCSFQHKITAYFIFSPFKGGQSFPYSFRDSVWMVKSTTRLMGAPFPSILESLWIENDYYSYFTC